MHKVSGVYCAAITPINHDYSVNKDLYLRHCQSLMKKGLDGLVLFGTNGEASSFSIQEKIECIQFLTDNKIDPQVMITGTGSSSLREAIELNKFSSNIGVKASLLLPPFYFKNVKDDGVLEYYRRVIEETGNNDFKFLLYNIPQHSGVTINFNIIETLLKTYPNNVVGLKDSTGNLDNMLKTIKYFNDFSVFCGNGALALHTSKRGGAGAITGDANITSKLLSFIIHNFKDEKSKANKFLKDLGNPFYLIASDANGKTSVSFGIYGIPETILVNKDLVIIKKYIGPIDEKDVKKIQKIVNEK